MKEVRINDQDISKRIFAQRGTSLLEALAYLGIAALVILGAIALLVGAFSGADSNRAGQDVTSIRTGIKKLFAGQPSGYASLSNATMIAAKVFPSSLTISGNNASNTWGGAVTVAGNATDFSITYEKVPQNVCVNIVAGNAEWTSVTVNGGTALAAPVTPSQASTGCSLKDNIIVWTGN